MDDFETLADQARTIAAQMRWNAEGLNRYSSASPPRGTFIPFAEWFEAVAMALESKQQS